MFLTRPLKGMSQSQRLTQSKPRHQKLEKKVNELTEQLEQLSKKTPNPIHDSNPLPVVKSKPDGTSSIENKIVELTKQVEKLAQKQRESEGTQKKDCLTISSNNMR